MEETINLKELFQALKKRLWIIVLITTVAATISSVISFFVLTPMYQSQAQILVNQAKSDQQLYNSGEVQTNIQLINTYNVIITSPTILNQVINDLNLNMTVDELTEQIEVTSAKDSQVVEVTVQNESPRMAVEIANTTAKVFKNQISEIMNIDNVNILSPAVMKEDMSPVSPRIKLNIAVGIAIGLIISSIIAIVLHYLDNTLKTEQDIEQILELPVIGVITNIKDVPKTTVRQTEPIGRAQRTRGETFGS
ncbi:YveK family protein [Priestia flexa]|uniref:YveK family protein n=1 Tax=Priestia flexa TaxID=86664 RepID=UPI0011A84F74|nr:Wzz/FepE/Etk N-terminal domain-containing protein [Priestia flexa]UZW66158.1 Wzz/FepE/Etk N-terminal domain-containing protein [Priestia flexa]